MDEVYIDIANTAKDGVFKIRKNDKYKEYYKDLEELGYFVGLIWISWDNPTNTCDHFSDYRCVHRTYDVSSFISSLNKGVIPSNNNRHYMISVNTN